MRPILFNKTATTFITNGIGRLDPVSCVVTEERNGQYELEMVVPLESEYADQIEMNSIIVVKPAVNTSQQAFRVYDIEKPINGKFTVHANHLSYQLNYVTVMPFSVTASSSACAMTLAQLKTNAVDTGANQFNFSTDVDTIASYAQTIPQVFRKCLGGMRGSVLDQFGGEFEWDNYNVILHETRGVQTPNVTLRYGKDITDISQEENIANTITGIVPYWVDAQGGELVTLSEKVVDSPYASQYPFKRTIPMDFSSDFEEKPTQTQLRAHAQAYVARAGIGVPKVNIKVSFIDLSQTEEYKDLLALQSVKLCDVIGVHFDTLGIDTTAKIVKVKYDCLKERYENIEIGSVKTDLSNTINDTNGAITALSNDTKVNFAKVTNEVQEDIDNATAWLTSSGGYVIAVKNRDGSWKELLFLDNNDIEEAVNVLRINENGIGFSSNGVAGPYTQAWTLDGRLVIGGTNVPSITVYDSQSNIIFQASADAMIWNATNSSMDEDGVITCEGADLVNAEIDDATITGGAITMVGASCWMVLTEGEIYGGRGTTPWQNQTAIYFDQLVNGQSGHIGFDARSLFINTDRISVTHNRGDSTGYEGYDGDIGVIDNNFEVNAVPDVDWYTYSNMLWNVSMNSDGTLNSWTIGNIQMFDGISINTSWDYSTHEVIHGILT